MAWPLRKTNHDSLSVIFPDWQSSSCAFLRGFKKVVDAVVIDFVIRHGHFDLGFASRVLLNLPRSSIDGAQQPGNDTSVCQGLPTAYGMRLARTRDSIREECDIEAFEEVFYRWRYCVV